MNTAQPASSGTDTDVSAITLAPMRRRHLPAVLAHERAVYDRPWTMGLFLSELARPETRSYVIARAHGTVVGHCGVLFIGDEGHLTTVVVAPTWQHRGVATRMLLYQMRHAARRGADALTLEVRMSNDAARALYGRFGFAPGGVRKGYYPESGEDALIMWAHDIDGADMRRRLSGIEDTLEVPTRFDNLGSDGIVASDDGDVARPAGAACEDEDGGQGGDGR